MKTYSEDLIVTLDDLDELNHVNNVRYIQWVNQIAKAHWFANATQEMLDQYFWVLISHQIDYKRQIFLGDTVTLKTYVKLCEGVTSLRVVEVLVNNKRCAYSETKWCFMNIDTKRPSRISPEIIALF
ncbi:acyl-CoA thioesterase [Olleya sp. HaHaR_3_96]|uniref:acyl-CoA thioesterase n=1 Tax=Olleya sp. HaHaR_3_96 TaxID=2745560 RepID=UPI001C4FDCC2|nr:thioesterase family protein [Olleya sp. HaHaR_3_96]QXP58293.1 thioesterase family protein [Olleya sp. HaHaR_3_96]